MEVKLINAIDYDKVKDIITDDIKSEEEKLENVLKRIEDLNGIRLDKDGIIDELKASDLNRVYKTVSKIEDAEKARHSEIVASAGRLSRSPGDVLEVLHDAEMKPAKDNTKTANYIMGLGHRSITDHDYLVFALKDVSVIIEHILISERFASFTIKSRREVDFRKAGYYVPEFRDEDGNIHPQNEFWKKCYKAHMEGLFNKYGNYVDDGISTEDARFILPYCFYSNIMMGIDAHVLYDIIVKFTKTKYAEIAEVKELGEKLYEIAKEYAPYIIPSIDKYQESKTDKVSEYLDSKMEREDYKIVDKVSLINSSGNIDDTILTSAIMRRYQYDPKKAKEVYDELSKDENFKEELMRLIALGDDKQELTQVNFQFQFPVSYAILTHFQRHRTHHFLMDDFTHADLTQYKRPPKIKDAEYDTIFKDNNTMYNKFKSYGIKDEDLIYFILAGNMTNIVTNMDGWTVRHILELRECTKAQWETRAIANGMHGEIDKLGHADIFSSVLGPTCKTKKICNEGKESCGKIKQILSNNEKK